MAADLPSSSYITAAALCCFRTNLPACFPLCCRHLPRLPDDTGENFKKLSPRFSHAVLLCEYRALVLALYYTGKSLDIKSICTTIECKVYKKAASERTDSKAASDSFYLCIGLNRFRRCSFLQRQLLHRSRYMFPSPLRFCILC